MQVWRLLQLPRTRQVQVLPPSGGRGGVGGGAQEGKEGAQQAEDSSPAVQV